ncbi:metallophosphoesterase [Shewanella baltica]|uniref:metallophosphoesterase n=1 Tax=Shewanella baltica TaxID=62322 RepID=UPI002871348C|nr:metallophosphoesterase [Shewanella baltica]MDR9765898.1 metallophosphoesterase [Shewanella baltica]
MRINSMPVGAHPITLSITRLSRASQWILKRHRKFTPLLWFVTALPFVTLSFNSLAANTSEAEPELNSQESSVTDGPYVFLNNAQKDTAYWICQSELKQTPIAKAQLTRPASCGKLPEPHLHTLAATVEPDTFTHVSKIVALSDVHGQFDVMINLLKAHKIIDKDNHWAFDDGHMVMTGDMFDRGHQVNEVLWFLYALDQEAQAAGGRLHLLMGNHEQMVFRGDLRYVNERYQVSADLLKRHYDALYNKNTEIGQWLRSKHTLVKINNILFMHGGISPEWVERKLHISEANQLFRQHLDDKKADLKKDDLLNFLFFTNGPTWYRGYFKDELKESDIDSILSYFKVEHIVVGHTSQEQVLGLYHNKIIAIDSSIKNGQSGELLLIDAGKLSRGLYQGEQVSL